MLKVIGGSFTPNIIITRKKVIGTTLSNDDVQDLMEDKLTIK